MIVYRNKFFQGTKPATLLAAVAASLISQLLLSKIQGGFWQGAQSQGAATQPP